MKRTLLATLLITFALSGQAIEIQELKSGYIKAGNEIVDMVNSNSIDVVKVEKNVLALTTYSVALAQLYIAKFPDGKALLQETINNVANMNGENVTGIGSMANESFKHIEDTWHDLGYTKRKDFGLDMEDEDNEHYTDPLHVMIHPIMVLVAARDGNGSAMKAEMDEGMEQIELLVSEL